MSSAGPSSNCILVDKKVAFKRAFGVSILFLVLSSTASYQLTSKLVTWIGGLVGAAGHPKSLTAVAVVLHSAVFLVLLYLLQKPKVQKLECSQTAPPAQ